MYKKTIFSFFFVQQYFVLVYCLPNLITQKETVRALCQDPGGSCFCSIRDSREDDYGDISSYYVQTYGPYVDEGGGTEEEETEENEVTTFNAIPPTGSVFDKVNALRKYWQKPWEEEEEVEEEGDGNNTELETDLICRTKCSSNFTGLSICAPYVNYPYCAREMKYNSTNITANVLASYLYIEELDKIAGDCVSSTIWKVRDGILHSEKSDCVSINIHHHYKP